VILPVQNKRACVGDTAERAAAPASKGDGLRNASKALEKSKILLQAAVVPSTGASATQNCRRQMSSAGTAAEMGLCAALPPCELRGQDSKPKPAVHDRNAGVAV